MADLLMCKSLISSLPWKGLKALDTYLFVF